MNLTKVMKLIVINIIVLIVLILGLEGISRVVFPIKETKAIFNDKDLRVRNRPFVQHHPTRGFALKPNFKNELYTIDADGFRVVPLNVPSPDKTILCMGESTTFGWMVKDNETYPYYLSLDLQQSGTNAKVINGGIPSYTSSQVLLYLKEILDKKEIKPNLVLVNIMWNDIWYSSVQNWHPDILIYQKPPSWMIWLDKYSHLYHVIQKFVISTHKTKQVDVFNQKALEKYSENLQDMIDICKKQGIDIAFVEPPLDSDHITQDGLHEFRIRYTKPYLIKMGQVYFDALKKVAKNNGIKVYEHHVGLKYLHQKNLFLDALHPTPQGNKIMADDITNQLIK